MFDLIYKNQYAALGLVTVSEKQFTQTGKS